MEKWHVHRNALIVGVLALMVLALLWPLAAHGGIYNNTGTLSEDSISIPFTLLDTLGNPVQAASGDSAWLFVWYPGGDLAFTDSVRIISDAKVATRNLDVLSRSMGFYTYQNAISAIDGGGLNGTYKWTLIDQDSSLGLQTTFHGEFQVLTSGDLSTTVDSINKVSDSVIVDGSAFADLDSIFNSDQFTYNTITNVKVSSNLLPDPAPGDVGGLIKYGAINNPLNVDANGLVYTNTDSDTGVAAIKTKLTTIAGDVVNLDGGTLLTTSDNIGIDWGNVSNPTTALDLSATTIRSTDSALIVNIKASDTVAVATKLAELDEDNTTIDLNNTSIGPVSSMNNNAIDSLDFSAEARVMLYNYARRAVWGWSDTTIVDTSQIGKWLIANVGKEGSASFPDSLAAYIASLGNQFLIDSALQLQTWAMTDSLMDTLHILPRGSATVPDSLLQVANDIDSLLIMAREFIADAPHSSDYGGNTTAGSGVIACSVYAMQSTTAIPGVRIYIYNSDLSSQLYSNPTNGTNSNGLSIFNLDASTTYKVTAQKTPDYSYDSISTYQTILTPSSGALIDTVPMTQTTIGSPATATLKRIYDYEEGSVYDGKIRKAGFPVVARLVSSRMAMETKESFPRDTVSNINRSWNDRWRARTNTSGLWTLDVPITTYLKTGSDTASVAIEIIMYDLDGVTPRWSVDRFITSDTTTECLRSIINGADCP